MRYVSVDVFLGVHPGHTEQPCREGTYLAQRSFWDSNKFLLGLAVALFKAETKHLHSFISLEASIIAWK